MPLVSRFPYYYFEFKIVSEIIMQKYPNKLLSCVAVAYEVRKAQHILDK
jgi:hypothetical protein